MANRTDKTAEYRVPSITRDLGIQAPRRSSSRGGATSGEECQGYGNVGLVLEGEFYQAGSFGLPIETMQPLKNAGNDPVLRTRNEILAKLQALLAQLAPGETVHVPVVLELRKRNQEVQPTEEEVTKSLVPDFSALAIPGVVRASSRKED